MIRTVFLGGKMKAGTRPLRTHRSTRLAEQLRLSVEERRRARQILNTDRGQPWPNATASAHRGDRGLDARDFALVAFGGAGPLHAVDVAQHLEMTRVVVPPHPGLVSALGTLMTDLRVDRARTVMHRSDRLDLPLLSRQLAEVTREALAEIRRDGLKGLRLLIANLSMRYLGQNFGELIKLREPDINQASFDQALEDMHARHEQLFGYAMRDRVIEITEVRVIALGEGNVSPRLLAPTGAGSGPYATRSIYFAGIGRVDTPIFRRHAMPEGARVTGPALIEEMEFDHAAASRQRCEGSRGWSPGHGSERVVRRERGDQGPACAGARPDHTDGGQQCAAQHQR